jgi:CheY-like chemotaxis protein
MTEPAKSTTSSGEFLALLVDDNPSILRATKDYFQRHGLRAIVASNMKEALRHVKSTPALDVIVTDVDLDPTEGNDTGGVTLAKEVRKIRAALPVLAYTGHKEEDFDAPVDWEVFDEPLSKGGGFKTIEENLEVCLKHAKAYRQKRVSSSKEELFRLQEKYDIPDYDVATLRSFIPGGQEDCVPESDLASAGMFSADDLLRRAGYELHLIEAGKKLGHEDVGQAVTMVPIPVWIRKDGGFYVAELYGHPCIYAEGGTADEAIAGVTMLMCGYHQDLQSNDSLGVELENLKEYLKRALSVTHATKHKRGD